MSKSSEATHEQLLESGPLYSFVREVAGPVPEIDLPEDIDISQLRKILGDDLDFVTLPIGEVGVTSRNDNTFHRTSIESMVEQINTKRHEGMWGHYDPWEISFKYDPPAVRWLAAKLDENGIAWGKLVPLNEETKHHFALADATGARVGTSLYGTDVAFNEDGEIVYFRLVTIDLSDPERVGVPMTAAKAKLTRQMHNTSPVSEEEIVDEKELKEAQTLVKTLTEEKNELNRQLREAREAKADLDEIRSLFEVAGDADVVKIVQSFIEESEDLAKENRELLREAIGSIIDKKVVIESARDIIKEMVMDRKPSTRKMVERTIEEILGKDSVKKLLREKVEEEAGPAETPSSENTAHTDAWKTYVEIPAE